MSGERARQANDNLRAAETEVRNSLVRAYRWALWPVQDDPQKPDYSFRSEMTNAADNGDIVLSALDKLVENEALIDRITPSALVNMLRRYVWSNAAYRDHVNADTLWDMMTSYVYMLRLRNKSVLETCIEQGARDGVFGVAEGYSESEGNYSDLRFKEPPSTSALGVSGLPGRLLVTPEMSDLVKEAEKEVEREEELRRGGDDDGPCGNGPPPPPPPPGPTRISATRTFQHDLSLDAVDQLRDEIIRNLNEDGGSVTVQITISAEKSDGFSEGTTRSVRENGQQLGLDLSLD